MWTYSQALGELFGPNGELVATGYSGHGEGVNNPALQAVHDVGPIPQGRYGINAPREVPGRGPYVLPLMPFATTDTFGRSGFLCHGDSIEHPGAKLASHGCVILGRAAREAIWQSGDHELEVIA